MSMSATDETAPRHKKRRFVVEGDSWVAFV
jgi:hypothetical protein